VVNTSGNRIHPITQISFTISDLVKQNFFFVQKEEDETGIHLLMFMSSSLNHYQLDLLNVNGHKMILIIRMKRVSKQKKKIEQILSQTLIFALLYTRYTTWSNGVTVRFS
jgi:hypothetical protein